MNQKSLLWITLIFSIQSSIVLSNNFKYPFVRRDDSVIDDYFGTKVADPYRWLENPDSNETKKFITEENIITKQYIETNKYRVQIKTDIENLYNYSKYGVPFKVGSKYYFTANTKLSNQDILYSIDSIDSNDPKEFLDPNQFSSDGTTFVIFSVFSKDGNYCAYGINKKGSDWTTVKVRDTKTMKDLPDTLTKVKFSNVAWSHDNLGFFYSQYDQYNGTGEGNDPTPIKNQKLFYHKINTNQSEDIKILSYPKHPNRLMIVSQMSEDGNYLFLFPIDNSNNLITYAKLSYPIKSPLNFITIKSEADAVYKYVTADDHWLYLWTNKDAPNYRLIRIDLNNAKETNWVNILPENKTKVMKSVVAVNDNYLAVVYMKDVIDSIEIYNLKDGKHIKTLDTKEGTVLGIEGRRNDSNLFFKISSFLSPGIVFRYDFKSNDIKIFRESKLNDLNTNDFVTKQIFVRSKDDQVNIPMFLVHRKNITLDGSNPTFMYAYGGFDSVLQPTYELYSMFFINNINGIYVMANLRGGGEYGESWHESGIKTKRQNVFDDFASAAEYLFKNNYTQRDRLTIMGYSNGGLLMGVSSNQRPDLFGCAIANVGVMDMIRFPLFTGGAFWTADYGDPQNNKTEFEYIFKYSPLHNIPKNGTQYPAILVLTADHDDRVIPGHSYKFAAQLQYLLGAKLSETPLMIRIDSNSGHGGGKPISKWVQEYTDIMSFILNSLNIDYNSRKHQ